MKAIINTVREALTHRGYSKNEADTIIKRLMAYGAAEEKKKAKIVNEVLLKISLSEETRKYVEQTVDEQLKKKTGRR